MTSDGTNQTPSDVDIPQLAEELGRALLGLSDLAAGLGPPYSDIKPGSVPAAAEPGAVKRGAVEVPAAATDIELPGHKEGEVVTVHGLTQLTYDYSSDTHALHQQLLAYTHGPSDVFFNLSRGANDVAVVCSAVLTARVLEVFAGVNLRQRQDHLTAVSVRLNPDKGRTAGMYHTIFKRFASEGVQFVNMVSSSTEISFLVQRNEVERAVAALVRILG